VLRIFSCLRLCHLLRVICCVFCCMVAAAADSSGDSLTGCSSPCTLFLYVLICMPHCPCSSVALLLCTYASGQHVWRFTQGLRLTMHAISLPADLHASLLLFVGRAYLHAAGARSCGCFCALLLSDALSS
jgi:hypothetical protein